MDLQYASELPMEFDHLGKSQFPSPAPALHTGDYDIIYDMAAFSSNLRAFGCLHKGSFKDNNMLVIC